MSYLGEDVTPRTREIMGSLVKHLHDFARETQLTHDEWRQGIAFLEALRAAQREWLDTLREGAEAAQRAGWRPNVKPEVLVAFSIAAATGTAELLSSETWSEVLEPVDDVDKFADDVLDLIVERTP